MTDVKHKSPPDKPTLADRFEMLCWARLCLWFGGEVEGELPDVVDSLQAWATSRGLVAVLGQDVIQEIIAKACREAR